jgi:hypothetical protein
VEKDEASNPVDIGFLGADAVVLETDAVAHVVEKARHGMRGLQTGRIDRGRALRGIGRRGSAERWIGDRARRKRVREIGAIHGAETC